MFENKLISAMSEWDLHINTVHLEPGIYHRFRSIGTCKTKCCEYRIYERQLGAQFRCFRRGINRFWWADRDTPFSLEEKRIMAMERDRVRIEREAMYAKCAKKCERFFIRRKSENLLKHPYIRWKAIYPYAAREARGMVVVPVTNVHRKFQTLQFIRRNGFKQLKAGGKAAEGMVWLCDRLPLDYAGVLRVCEGWSTGCTVRWCTQSPVVCALNAYNLPKVCVALYRAYPNAKVIICADNDQWGEKNTGVMCAEEAARKTGFPVYVPDFSAYEQGNKPTDYNDLFLLGGKEEVRRQLTIK